MGVIVYFGTGLSYRPASLCSRVGRYYNLYAGVNFIPLVRDYEVGYWTISRELVKVCLYVCMYVCSTEKVKNINKLLQKSFDYCQEVGKGGTHREIK